MQMAVEGSVDLLIIVATLFRDVPQEHQLGLQAVFITESTGSMHQSRQNRLFLGWVTMGFGVEVEIGVCGLAVHFVSQRTIGSPVNIQVQVGGMAFAFGFCGQLNGLMDVV
jgi:hypothetical protein